MGRGRHHSRKVWSPAAWIPEAIARLETVPRSRRSRAVRRDLALLYLKALGLTWPEIAELRRGDVGGFAERPFARIRSAYPCRVVLVYINPPAAARALIDLLEVGRVGGADESLFGIQAEGVKMRALRLRRAAASPGRIAGR